MDKPIINLKNVSKTYKLYKNAKKSIIAILTKRAEYKSIHAVNDLSLTINKGESVAILGHNGAGKSTLLKMITGVVFPTGTTTWAMWRVCTGSSRTTT